MFEVFWNPILSESRQTKTSKGVQSDFLRAVQSSQDVPVLEWPPLRRSEQVAIPSYDEWP
jgi:hypothetical protein